MENLSRYPKFNDAPHVRPALTMHGRSPIGEWVWVIIPVALGVLVMVLR